ncbi:MAG: nuclease-related domain-containing protein, partial [Streptosporangiaceae bacterium]
MATRVWQRYGRLRIYVSVGDLEAGWSEPRTGRFVLARPDLEQAFWAEVEAECQRLRRDGRLGPDVPDRRQGAAEPPETEPAGAEPTNTEPTNTEPADAHWVVRDSAWDDLATNQPGAAASARARELRREHPLLTTAADLVGMRSAARAFAIGARGERAVGRKLGRWAGRHDWHVLHAVPVGRRGADIDHVVIGPFGVVTINTKATGTTVWVGEHGMMIGGTRVDYVRKSRSEAVRARRLLGRALGGQVPVQSVIVFVGARRFSIVRGGPADVAVLPSARALYRWLRRQRAVLDAGQAEA